MKSKSRIIFEDQFGVSVELQSGPGKTVLEIAVENSVDISHSCGGMGSCGTCCVRLAVLGGVNPVRNEIEQEMATDRGFEAEERLSCQIECPAAPSVWMIRFKSEE